jgi:TM2 domain-containing membrane protein YozV
MPVILHGDGLHKLYVGTAGRGQVNATALTHIILLKWRYETK